MGLVTRIPTDPILDLYRQVKQLRTDLNRVGSRDSTLPLRTPTGHTFHLTPGDGNYWIDTSDGSLHWKLGGVEYKVTGTVV